MRRDTIAAAADVDTAIERVLAAEADARGAVAEVERACAAALDAARARSRAIAERAERRIREARERFEANVAREVQEIHAEAEALETRHALTPDEANAVRAAAVALAAELTGGRNSR